ncbi:hypothetical protein ABEX78_21685 [Priestia megaterium]
MKAIYENFLNNHFKDKLPLTYDDSNIDFKSYIAKYLRNYREEIMKSDLLNANQKITLNDIVLGILGALEKYYLGQPWKAYVELKEGLERISSYLRILSDTTVNTQKLYRIRLSDNADSHTFDYNEMFHIPFEKRHLVSSQRFSIPGLPAIYLGSSLYVCWEELGRPNFKNIKASMFKYHKSSAHRIINLGVSHKELKRVIENKEILGTATNKVDARSILVAYCIVWPLIVACSVKVKEKNATFKPEYIIPQLLSQYVASEKRDGEENFIGIAYLSVSGAYYNEDNEELFCNYFFPVMTNKSKGHCPKLSNTFKLTKGIPWQIFEIHTSAGMEESKIHINDKHWLPLVFEDVNSKIDLPYGRTDFGRFESFLEDNVKVNSVNIFNAEPVN